MTALITGASSGIGRVFAEHLAADKHDLIIVARRENKLRELADAMQSAHGISVNVVTADLAIRSDIERIARVIASTDTLEVLINNAGFGTSGLFYESDISKQQAMLDVHISATMQFTRAALPVMIARRRGTIINVSSVASFMYGDRRANYCASKAYINVFTQSVQEEVREHGIKLQALCPGFTYTEFHDTEEFEKFERTSVPKFMWMRAEDVVETSLRALESRRTIVIPGIYNRLIVLALQTPLLGRLLTQIAQRRRRRTR
jgi:short-subunit dehydrogenase